MRLRRLRLAITLIPLQTDVLTIIMSFHIVGPVLKATSPTSATKPGPSVMVPTLPRPQGGVGRGRPAFG